jgi:hypothetical protein
LEFQVVSFKFSVNQDPPLAIASATVLLKTWYFIL